MSVGRVPGFSSGVGGQVAKDCCSGGGVRLGDAVVSRDIVLSDMAAAAAVAAGATGPTTRGRSGRMTATQ